MARSSRPEFVIKKAKEGASSKRLSFPSSPYPHSILFVFKKYNYTDLEGNYKAFSGQSDLKSQTSAQPSAQTANVGNTSSIELPFPAQLQDDIGIKLNGIDRDFATEKIAQGLATLATTGNVGAAMDQIKNSLGGMAGAGAGMMSEIAKSMQQIGSGDFSQAKDVLTKAFEKFRSMDAKGATAAAGYALRSYLPGDMGKTIDAVTGKTLNPKETMAFGGVDLKSYTFDWTLFPQSPQDSDLIKNIINLLKSNALPVIDTSTSAPFEKAFLNFPAVVETSLIGVDESFYPRFKPAMISGVTADYAGGQDMAIMKGGRPAAVTLGLSISELAIHTAEDYSSSSSEPEGSNDAGAVG